MNDTKEQQGQGEPAPQGRELSRDKFTDEWLDNFWQLSECNYRDFGRGIVETYIAAAQVKEPK